MPIAILTLMISGTAIPQTSKTLTLESWRSADRMAWEEIIIPAFEASHPSISLEFRPTEPTRYDAEIAYRLETQTAGDLITCRPFDQSLALYEAGYFTDIGNLSGMEHFSSVAKSSWQTDDGTTTYCVPVASVIHGFIYNREIFKQLGLDSPITEDEFFAVLERIRTDGRWIPMAMGLASRWPAATMGYNNIGPTYWRGEKGRLALIKGRQKLDDEPWVAPYRTLSRWRQYLGEGYANRSYRESQALFTRGRAAIYPAGSWEIAGFNAEVEFEMGAFPPPVRKAGDECYISDHFDMGIGLNSGSRNEAAALRFLEWLATEEFATLYVRALPGFYPLSSHEVTSVDPVANKFLSWRRNCHQTIRYAAQYLSRSTPDLEQESWDAAVRAIAGKAKPEDIGAQLQCTLDLWYQPGQ
ncbi:MAG: ABC transporter substrate-binding protein [Gammaproteobacteria bacterium]|nr:ABC transporter substrate-binding protein [Gammaproteobacteria bacterium]